MIGVRHAAGIGKMSAGTAELYSPGIHHCGEILDRTADILSHLCRHIVGRREHGPIEELLESKNFTDSGSLIGTAAHSVVDSGLRHRDRIGHIAVL